MQSKTCTVFSSDGTVGSIDIDGGMSSAAAPSDTTQLQLAHCCDAAGGVNIDSFSAAAASHASRAASMGMARHAEDSTGAGRAKGCVDDANEGGATAN